MNYQSLIEHKLNPQGISGNDIIYVCPNPNCDDSSGHMYVNYEKNKFHCFKCNVGGQTLSGLLKLLNITADFDYDKLYDKQDKSLDDIISMKKVKKSEDRIVDYSSDLDALNYYYHYHVMDSYLSPQAYEYLKNRGFTDETIVRLRMAEGINRYGEKFTFLGKEYVGRDYSGRIMIPSLRKDGKVSFYLGRDYTGTKSNKYSNAPKEIAVASEDVWGLDTIEGSTVIICEGVLSAASVDNALGKHIACATYGKSIAQKSSETEVNVTSQGEKLLNKGFENYIMFYDKDAISDAYKNAKYLYERGAKVRVVVIPEDMYGDHADAGDMTKEEIIELIKSSKEFDPFDLGIIGLM